MSNDLIIVEQLPVITERLNTIKGEIEQAVTNALSLVVNEDTYKEVKKYRAGLNADYKALEEQRKQIKKMILAPYEQFEAIYKDCVTNVYLPADRQLSDKITDVESGLKAIKEEDIREYFNELIIAEMLDFIKFEDCGITVTMSASVKSLKEAVKEFINKVKADLEMIALQEHKEEILVEYKTHYNASQAITTVYNRHKAIEAEADRLSQVEQETSILKAVAEATINALPPIIEEVIQPELHMTFEVIGSIEQLKSVKEFLINNNIKYRKVD